VIKWIRWAELEASMGEVRNAYKFLPGNQKGRNCVGDVGMALRVILIVIYDKHC
jgi:hypothetical protein